jgi:hypothetical protein
MEFKYSPINNSRQQQLPATQSSSVDSVSYTTNGVHHHHQQQLALSESSSGDQSVPIVSDGGAGSDDNNTGIHFTHSTSSPIKPASYYPQPTFHHHPSYNSPVKMTDQYHGTLIIICH